MTAAAVLDLSPGAGLVLDGTEWTVERREPHLGRAQLVKGDGTRERVTFRFLANHPQCRPSSRTSSVGADRGRQRKASEDLKAGRLELTELRMAHLLEVATGFRSGDPFHPGPGEPRVEYDPRRTTLTERRHAKVAELAALDPQHAKLLGLGSVGYRTLIRWENARRRFGLAGCADDRWLRRSGGTRTVSEEVREGVLAVREETQRMAKVSMRTKDRMIRQYVREEFGPETKVPSYDTLRRLWQEWFGPGGARQRYARSADLPESQGHVLVHRPGQVVALDTTVLPVMVREHVFGDPVKMHLTLALDVCTHSLVAFRLTLVSDTSVDVAMVLRDVTMPLPMRADWGEDLEWPYPGLPAAVVAEFAGHAVAGLPFFTPETVTTDHGSVYRNHHLVEVERVLGCQVLPARVLRPTDKAAVERAFGVIRQLLFEHLVGYTGVDVADRGADPAGDAVLTADQLEHLIATWIVGVWQKRKLGEYAPAWDPDGSHSPNSVVRADRLRDGHPLPRAVLRAAARPLRPHRQAPRGEDPRTLVRRHRGPAGLPRPAVDAGRQAQGQVAHPPRPAGPAPGVLPGPAQSNKPSTSSPPNSSQAPPSTTNTDARPSPPGRWNPRTGSTYSPSSRASPAIERPSATTADAWPSAPTSGPASPKASPTSRPARRISPPTPNYAPSGSASDTTSSTGSAKWSPSPTTVPSSRCSKTTPSTWPRRSTATQNAISDNQPAYVTTTALRLITSTSPPSRFR
ncbi:transposase [Streptomyces sp. NPDC059788]|uniref:transposase n=1 Tax=Streptomyces sp. NPDC059788 TaxID=3346948 RepID=UPI003665878D